ncbi:uncharacterized protein LOC123545367 [Mercenaria mercenaria]|uniref:uncharacterized protein LOC123545367 n=1 Tax=Mercenaria mercenaria TaxID=6596 RepID=UPI00234EBA52|nr:uncharacterized protein LOC123545367 [Mercenaria mercenaria]
MDALRKMTICYTIWTLIMLRIGAGSVQINSPRAVFHLVREKYLQKQIGSIAEISRNGLHDTEQDTSIIKVENKVWNHSDVSHLIKKSRRQADGGDNKVAFYVVLSTDVADLGDDQTIPFDQVILDEGNAFGTVFHAFACPVTGVYLFRSALMCEANSHIETEVVKDGFPFFRMYSSGIKTSYQYDQGFNAGITKCEMNQRVWVRVNGNLGTSVRHLFTTFSGYLLWETGASQTAVSTNANSINVAFHSYLGKNINDLESKQTIPFDKLLLNEGDGYENNTRHEFTCPVDGIYMFQSSVFSNFGAIETEIVKDGDQFVRIYAAASGESNLQHDQGFNAGIIHCNKGQNVWVQARQGASIMQYQYTTFSGYLMWAIEEASAIPEKAGRAHDMDPTQVVFHSYLSTGVASIGEKLTVPFDKVSVNEGSGFDIGFHTFICPVNGIYVFQSAIMVNASQIETDIVKNESSFSNMFAGVGNYFDQGYNSGIVNCSFNERVWVWVGSPTGTSINYHNTTFSGFLLWGNTGQK